MAMREKATYHRAPLALFLIICVGGFTYLFGPIDPIPRLHASAESPDREITVKVYRKRVPLWPPAFAVIAKVYDKRSEVLLEKELYADGWWYDAEYMYRRITFEGGDILIGPKFSFNEYAVIREAEYATVTR
jgi:hypothetical protein